MAEWARLGAVRVAGLLSAAERTSTFDYDELKRIEGKPRLQWMADGLTVRTLVLQLHRQVCDPEAELRQLADAAAGHAALPLIRGTGELLGDYVIVSLAETDRHSDEDGRPVSIELRVDLKEFVPADPVLVVQLKAAAKKARAGAEAQQAPAEPGAFEDWELEQFAGGQSVMPQAWEDVQGGYADWELAEIAGGQTAVPWGE